MSFFFVCLDVDMDSTSMAVFMLSPMQKPKIHRHTEHVKLCLHLSLLSDMHINDPCLHFAYKHIEKKTSMSQRIKTSSPYHPGKSSARSIFIWTAHEMINCKQWRQVSLRLC